MTPETQFADDPTAYALFLAYVAFFENEQTGNFSRLTNRQIGQAMYAFKAAHPELWHPMKVRTATNHIRQLAAQQCH